MNTLPEGIKLQTFGIHRIFGLRCVHINAEDAFYTFGTALESDTTGGVMFGGMRPGKAATDPPVFKCYFSACKLPGIYKYFDNPNRPTLADFR